MVLPRTRHPEQRIFRIVSWRDAEIAAAAWMRTQGVLDAKATAATRDFGVDVTSSRYVAQVKWQATNVGAPAVREIYGVTRSQGKRCMFFAKAGYTPDARAFANQTGMALFVLTDAGLAQATNEPAAPFISTVR